MTRHIRISSRGCFPTGSEGRSNLKVRSRWPHPDPVPCPCVEPQTGEVQTPSDSDYYKLNVTEYILKSYVWELASITVACFLT